MGSLQYHKVFQFIIYTFSTHNQHFNGKSALGSRKCCAKFQLYCIVECFRLYAMHHAIYRYHAVLHSIYAWVFLIFTFIVCWFPSSLIFKLDFYHYEMPPTPAIRTERTAWSPIHHLLLSYSTRSASNSQDINAENSINNKILKRKHRLKTWSKFLYNRIYYALSNLSGVVYAKLNCWETIWCTSAVEIQFFSDKLRHCPIWFGWFDFVVGLKSKFLSRWCVQRTFAGSNPKCLTKFVRASYFNVTNGECKNFARSDLKKCEFQIGYLCICLRYKANCVFLFSNDISVSCYSLQKIFIIRNER